MVQNENKTTSKFKMNVVEIILYAALCILTFGPNILPGQMQWQTLALVSFTYPLWVQMMIGVPTVIVFLYVSWISVRRFVNPAS